MTNKQVVEMLECMVMDEEELNKIILLEGDEFADAIVGLTDDYHLVYSYEKIVASLAKADDITEEEAAEFVDFNTIRSLPYMANRGNAPIIIYELCF